MLPNGTMLISTGLLCTLDSEDELAAIIANEMSHFVLDHQVNNIYRAERRAKRAAFWGTVLAVTAEVALEVAYWDDDDTALGVGAVASIGSIAALPFSCYAFAHHLLGVANEGYPHLPVFDQSDDEIGFRIVRD